MQVYTHTQRERERYKAVELQTHECIPLQERERDK